MNTNGLSIYVRVSTMNDYYEYREVRVTILNRNERGEEKLIEDYTDN